MAYRGTMGLARPVPMDDNTLLAGEGFKITKAELKATVESQEPQERPQLEKNLLFLLDNLRKNCPGRLNVVFVHVRKEAILAARYGIRSIPIQAFFDEKGKEVFRHVGFFPEDEVAGQLSRMGVKK